MKEIVAQIGKGKSFDEIINNLDSACPLCCLSNASALIRLSSELPAIINRTYVDQANFWLTFFPLRGFLAVFDLAQILNLLWIWFKTKCVALLHMIIINQSYEIVF